MPANWLITCCLLHKSANWLDENQFDGVITEMVESEFKYAELMTIDFHGGSPTASLFAFVEMA